MSKKYKVEKIEENKKAEAEIKGSVPADIFKEYVANELKEIQKGYEAKGFRKGKVPIDVIEKTINKDQLLNEAANSALKDIYLDIIKESEIDVMGLPQISITKMAEGNDLGFNIKVGIFPETKLPNYKKIAKQTLSKEKKIEVTEEDIEAVIQDIMRIYEENSPEKEKDNKKKKDEKKDKKELTDEFVKKLGKFKDVNDFKEKIKENLKAEKTNEAKNKQREELAKKLTEETKVTIPEIVINQEVQSFLAKLIEDLKKREMTIKEYLEKTNKKEDEFFEEQKNLVENQLKMRLILEAIARKEDIKVSDEEIAKEMEALKNYYPNTSEDNLKNYVSIMIANEKVLSLLEKEVK